MTTTDDPDGLYDFSDEEPTQPIPVETRAEVSAKWHAALQEETIATSDRVTKNIRRPITNAERFIEKSRSNVRSHNITPTLDIITNNPDHEE